MIKIIPFFYFRITLDCFIWVWRSVREFKVLTTSKLNLLNKWILISYYSFKGFNKKVCILNIYPN